MFVGQFTLAAAHSVAGDADDEAHTVTNAVASLVDKSLIWISSTSGPAYYRLLDTTRAYAAARLAESEEAEAFARRHALYFAAFLKAATIEGPVFEGRKVATYAPHVGNVRKALAWSFSSMGDPSIGIELATRAARLFLEVSLFAECRGWCRRALAALRETDRGTLRELELQKALAMSAMYGRGNSKEVRAAIDRGLELAETLQEGRHQLHLLGELSVFLTRRGDFGGALEAAKRSAAIAETSGDAAEKVVVEWMLGTVYRLVGDQAAGLRHCQLGFRLAWDVPPAQLNFFGYDHRVRALVALAQSLWASGFPDQARELARCTINEAAEYNHPISYCIALIYSIPVFLWSGDPKAVAEPIELAIRQATKYFLAPYHAVGLALKGAFIVASGDAASGVEILRPALRAMHAEQFHIVTSSTSCVLARGLSLSGQSEEAQVTIEDALLRAEEAGELLWLPDLLRTRGEVHLALPRPDLGVAEESLLRSIDQARKQFAPGFELKAAIPLARMWREHGRSDQAGTMLAEIYQRFTEGFETEDLIAARKILEELGRAPPDCATMASQS